MRSVQLDCDLRARTEEIDDEAAERVLAANRNSQPRSAELGPENDFFRRRISSELSAQSRSFARGDPREFFKSPTAKNALAAFHCRGG
jgi:hypothetical protein